MTQSNKFTISMDAKGRASIDDFLMLAPEPIDSVEKIYWEALRKALQGRMTKMLDNAVKKAHE